MSFRVKTVVATVLGLCSFTAAIAGGVSGANEAPSFSGNKPVTLTSPMTAAPNQKIRFAPMKEVVQPLGAGQMQPNAGMNSASAPRAEDLLAVPDSDRDYESLAAMVRDIDTTVSLDDETRCLATAIFYESRSESLEGQLAVARVIINRADSSRFGDDICGVVKQPGQFSFVRGGVIPEPNSSRAQWKTAVAIAHIAENNAWRSEAEGALYFHARRVSPSWGKARVAVIDNHIFYR